MQQFLDVISPGKRVWHFPFTKEICRTTLWDSESVSPDGEQFGHCSLETKCSWDMGNKMQRIVFPKCVTFSDFSRTKYDIRVFGYGFRFWIKVCPSHWFLMYFKHLCLHLGLIFHKSHSVFCIVLTFYSKTGRWSIVTPVTQWDLVQAQPKLRDKWPNCQVAFTLHKCTNTKTQIHKNTNTQKHKHTNTNPHQQWLKSGELAPTQIYILLLSAQIHKRADRYPQAHIYICSSTLRFNQFFFRHRVERWTHMCPWVWIWSKSFVHVPCQHAYFCGKYIIYTLRKMHTEY